MSDFHPAMPASHFSPKLALRKNPGSRELLPAVALCVVVDTLEEKESRLRSAPLRENHRLGNRGVYIPFEGAPEPDNAVQCRSSYYSSGFAIHLCRPRN